MVSFRFYIVSITAVFLALAVGITMGATVIDRATVELLRTQIKTAQAQRTATSAENKSLRKQVSDLKLSDSKIVPNLVAGALTGVPVVIVAVQGPDIDRNVEDVTRVLTDAGATLQGQIGFTKGLRLDKGDNTVAQLAAQLNLTGSLQVDDVRKAALVKLAAWLASPPATADAPAPGKSPLDVMKSMGLVQQTPSMPVTATTRFVVISSATPDVPNEQVAGPFTSALALQSNSRVLAAEPGVNPEPDASPPVPEVREVFLAPLRADGSLKGKLSTIDNIEDINGRAALVYAIRELPNTGHYGVGAHASDGPVPKS